MRVTNQMMINSSIANIQANKNQINNMDTQLSTQKKINKPSDDPIIAIRALRLRSSLDQVTQYVDKNIPDASSWLSVTQDALAQGYDIVYQLYSYCNQGATDSYSSSERNTIIETLDKLRDSYYVQGDVDYAGRYVFTGYATDKPLTYQSDAAAADVDYTITQKFGREGISEKKVYTNAYSNEDIINLNVKKDADGKIVTPNVETVHRIQLAYSEIDADGTFKITDASGNAASIVKNEDGSVSIINAKNEEITITKEKDEDDNDIYVARNAEGNEVEGYSVKTDADGNITGITGTMFDASKKIEDDEEGTDDIEGADDNADDDVDDTTEAKSITIAFTTDSNYIPDDDEIAINSQLGEVLLGQNIYEETYKNNSFAVQYEKSNFKKGDVNPTMYFDCVDNVTGVEYAKKSEDIEYNVNFTQKLKVNTQADESFDIYLGRNVDDIMAAVQNTIDVENQIKKVESMKNEERYSSEENQKALDDILEGLNKQNDLAKSQMTKAFEKGIGQMQGYQEEISNAKADVGNRIQRLDLTKTRLTEQKTNFTSLKSQNEDIDLEEVVVNYTAAQLVYNAALSAASKVVQQTLLDFIG